MCVSVCFTKLFENFQKKVNATSTWRQAGTRLMGHIQGSVTTHPVICSSPSRVCNNPSGVCNDTSGVCIPQNTDCGCGVTDSGWAVTDHWMGRYRPLDVPHILAGTAVALFLKVFVQNKTNRLYQGISLYIVRSFEIFVNPLFNALNCYCKQTDNGTVKLYFGVTQMGIR